jgi:DNA-binding transcriptional MerR regulator
MNTELIKPEKLFYSIGEVSEMFDVNASLVRFWEKEFDIIKPKKNAKGNRLFTSKDIQNFKLIYHLVKEQKLTLDGARKKLKENKDSVDYSLEIVEKLKSVRQQLVSIKEAL